MTIEKFNALVRAIGANVALFLREFWNGYTSVPHGC